jgi:predicted transporter
MRNPGYPITATLLFIVGMMGVLTGHLGSATWVEKQVNGPVAVFIGVLLIGASMYLLREWFKQFKNGPS